MRPKFPFALTDLQIKLDHHLGMDGEGGFIIIVKGKGLIIYTEMEYNRITTRRKINVNPFEVFELFCFAHENGFFEMQRSYITGSNIFFAGDGQITISQEMITDLPSTTLTIKTGKQVKSVWNYYGAPKRLIQIENKIKKLAKKSGV